MKCMGYAMHSWSFLSFGVRKFMDLLKRDCSIDSSSEELEQTRQEEVLSASDLVYLVTYSQADIDKVWVSGRFCFSGGGVVFSG